MKDGAEVAERIANGAFDTRKKLYAAIRYFATFHDEVEELVPMWHVLMEVDGRKHRKVRAVEGGSSTFIWCGLKSLYDKVGGVCQDLEWMKENSVQGQTLGTVGRASAPTRTFIGCRRWPRRVG